MPGAWQSFECPESSKRWRFHDDGLIEIEGIGIPEAPWPADVDQWWPLIQVAAAKHGVPAVWVASTMAQETGGRNVCVKAADPSKVCGPPCDCYQGEGAGVMAMLPSTASSLAGRKITSNELLADSALAIELGAKYIRYNLDKNGNNFVRASLSYNAGSVKCGRGSTMTQPKEPCPNTGWGVVMGCVHTAQKYGSRCAPSTAGSKPYVCSTDYPTRSIEAQNAARRHFEGVTGPGDPPTTDPPIVVAGLGGGARVAMVAVGLVAGYALLSYLER